MTAEICQGEGQSEVKGKKLDTMVTDFLTSDTSTVFGVTDKIKNVINSEPSDCKNENIQENIQEQSHKQSVFDTKAEECDNVVVDINIETIADDNEAIVEKALDANDLVRNADHLKNDDSYFAAQTFPIKLDESKDSESTNGDTNGDTPLTVNGNTETIYKPSHATKTNTDILKGELMYDDLKLKMVDTNSQILDSENEDYVTDLDKPSKLNDSLSNSNFVQDKRHSDNCFDDSLKDAHIIISACVEQDEAKEIHTDSVNAIPNHVKHKELGKMEKQDNSPLFNHEDDDKKDGISDCVEHEKLFNAFSDCDRVTKSVDLCETDDDLMKFAEVLYKCTLCTSIPAILTSKSSFLDHVSKDHLTAKRSHVMCNQCSLKLRTNEDLKEHILEQHSVKSEFRSCDKTGSDAIPSIRSCDKTGSDVMKLIRSCETTPSDVIKSLDRLLDNESDSDSSGHRQHKAKVVRRNCKPLHDFENPKQLVDHAGIETLNGSLDLSTRDLKSKDMARDNLTHGMSNSNDRQSPRTNDVNLINVQQITDQILKSNAQSKTKSTANGQKFSFTPSFTPEFGKYTKLVREGGNIVYFCQVCNWKSPVKSTFHVHCGTSSHKSKVISADDPDSLEVIEPSNKTSSSEIKIPNVSVGNLTESKLGNNKSDFWSSQSVRAGSSKTVDKSLFYNYIRPRGVSSKSNRTPVVSPFRNGMFEERPDSSYRRHFDGLSNTSTRKRKKQTATMQSSHSKSSMNACNSDSDSDGKFSNQESHLKKHSANMSLLRSKLLREYFESGMKDSGASKHNPHNDPKTTFGQYWELQSDQNKNPGHSLRNGSSNLNSNSLVDLMIVKSEHSDSLNSRISPVPSDDSKRKHGGSAVDYNEREREPTQKRLRELLMETSHVSPDRNILKNKISENSNRCHACAFEYSDIEEYEKHFEKTHKVNASYDNMTLAGSLEASQRSWLDKVVCSSMQGRHDEEMLSASAADSAVNMEMGENWRVQKLKEILPEYLVLNDTGNTSRDYLLQCISISAGLPDATLWSSACNKAMREVYPTSLAQRKGKHKNKTYYFGVCMIERYQGQEEVPTPQEPEGQTSQVYTPLRDINIDMEKIIEHLPGMVKWTGCMESGVHRGEILVLLADILGDHAILGWGAQCNRAIRLVFPMVDMKRKGKNKTTIYYGVEFYHNIKQKLYSNKTAAAFSSHLPDSPTNFTTKIGQVPEFQSELFTTKKDNSNDPLMTAPKGDNLNVNNKPQTDTMAERISVYPQWFKQEARSEMDQYLAKFGGVALFDDENDAADDVDGNVGDVANNDDDNDGDDEGGSIDSSLTL